MLSNKKTKKAYLLSALIAAAVLVIALVSWFVIARFFTPTVAQYSGPTAEEQAAGNEAKEKIVGDEQKQDESSSSTTTDATVTISYAAFTEGVAEVNASTNYYADGECTFTFSQGALSVKKVTPAYMDARSTICTNPNVPRGEFAKSGDWSVVVSYISTDGKTTGTSSAATITIP